MIINRLIFEGYISKLLSSFIYTIASIHIPLKARKRILKYLAKRLNITVEEAEYPIHKYKTINQLFTRGLKKDARPIDSNTLSIVSPVDGKIIGYGQLSKTTDTLPSPLKGHYFNIDELIGTHLSSKLNSYSYVSIYLSPSDCHRIMSPIEGNITDSHYIKGHLYPVREPYISNTPNIYNRNERSIVTVSNNTCRIHCVAVAAVNVSKIDCTFDPSFIKEAQKKDMFSKKYVPSIHVSKAEWIQTFLLGSTIVLIIDQPITFSKNMNHHACIKYGMTMGQANAL